MTLRLPFPDILAVRRKVTMVVMSDNIWLLLNHLRPVSFHLSANYILACFRFYWMVSLEKLTSQENEQSLSLQENEKKLTTTKF